MFGVRRCLSPSDGGPDPSDRLGELQPPNAQQGLSAAELQLWIDESLHEMAQLGAAEEQLIPIRAAYEAFAALPPEIQIALGGVLASLDGRIPLGEDLSQGSQEALQGFNDAAEVARELGVDPGELRKLEEELLAPLPAEIEARIFAVRRVYGDLPANLRIEFGEQLGYIAERQDALLF